MSNMGKRVSALRRAIDLAVADLNEAWGGFGPNEELERAITTLQTVRTNDDIAQGSDWPPVVVTDDDDLVHAARAVVLAATSHTPEIAALNRALARPPDDPARPGGPLQWGSCPECHHAEGLHYGPCSFLIALPSSDTCGCPRRPTWMDPTR